MGITCEKRLIYIGRTKRGTGGVGEGAWAGIPHVGNLLGAETRDVVPATSPINTFDNSSYVLLTPGRAHTAHGPISCIAIAPDSPIESCDLHIGNAGGVSAHRVSVGAPFVGEIADGQSCWVTPTRTIPVMYRDGTANLTAAQFRRSIVAWDMDVNDDIDDATAASVICAPKIPLRLELYRGGVPSFVPSKRGPYSASLVAEVDTAAGAEINPTLIVVTDGRRRVRVVASGPVTSTLEVHGIESLKNIHDVLAVANELSANGRFDRAYFDQLLAPTALTVRPTPLIFDYTGNPYFAFICRITGVDGDQSHLDLHCWDD